MALLVAHRGRTLYPWRRRSRTGRGDRGREREAPEKRRLMTAPMQFQNTRKIGKLNPDRAHFSQLDMHPWSTSPHWPIYSYIRSSSSVVTHLTPRAVGDAQFSFFLPIRLILHHRELVATRDWPEAPLPEASRPEERQELVLPSEEPSHWHFSREPLLIAANRRFPPEMRQASPLACQGFTLLPGIHPLVT